MADNADITPGSGKTIAADERTINSATVLIQRVTETGGSSITSGRASVTTTAGSAIAARETRKRVVILALPTNTDIVEVGDSGVAAGADYPLYPGASITLFTTAAIHADAVSGTQSLAYIEEHD